METYWEVQEACTLAMSMVVAVEAARHTTTPSISIRASFRVLESVSTE